MMTALAALLSCLPNFIKLKLSLLAFEKFTDTFKFGKLKSELEGKDFYTTEAFRNKSFSVLLEGCTKKFYKYTLNISPSCIQLPLPLISYPTTQWFYCSLKTFLWAKKNTQYIYRQETIFHLISDLMVDNSPNHLMNAEKPH